MPSDLIVLTRREVDNRPLAAALEAAGLRARSYPCIATKAVVPSDEVLWELSEAGPMDAMAFPSRAAVEALYEQPVILGNLFPGGVPLLASVGPATSKSLAARHRSPDIQAEPATGAALAVALAQRLGPGARVLLPCGDKPRPELSGGLKSAGLQPHLLQVYAHEDPEPDPLQPPAPAVVVCASPSAAAAFLHANPNLRDVAFVAIGPTTETSLRELGATRITRAAATHLDALIDAVHRALPTPG